MSSKTKEMTPLVKIPAVRPEDLSSNPQNHGRKEELTPARVQTCACAHMHTHKHVQTHNRKHIKAYFLDSKAHSFQAYNLPLPNSAASTFGQFGSIRMTCMAGLSLPIYFLLHNLQCPDSIHEDAIFFIPSEHLYPVTILSPSFTYIYYLFIVLLVKSI